MDEFDTLYNQRIINEERLTSANQTQAKKVLSSNSPTANLNEFNEVAGDTRAVTHLGPSSVPQSSELMEMYGRGRDIPTLETLEEVFMNENFDNRDYFDSALQVEHQVFEEMVTPVVEVQMNNSEIKNTDLPEGKAEAKSMSFDKDKMLKYGMAAAIAFLLFRGK